MSKEIDVSGCKNYSFKEFINFTECPDYCADYLDGICSNHPDCYYRQLKRLEQENAKLKGSNESLIRQFSARKLISGTEALFDITTAEFNYQIQRLKEENKKLKEALEEIRGMAIYDCERECSNNSENCTIGSCLEKRIQRKINEVLKDE